MSPSTLLAVIQHQPTTAKAEVTLQRTPCLMPWADMVVLPKENDRPIGHMDYLDLCDA